ncbi:hypothetical protein EDD21DRAFT_234588 [Dissophora ornata]|nr:hypothetical protein EDD21DRAFT_234588 [Dissophora ornata]
MQGTRGRKSSSFQRDMNSISRTTIILDHSLQARRRACHDSSKASGGASDDTDDEFDLEPCSMWSSFIHASLHYARLAWDLSPVGQKSQVSIHAAPGPATTHSSAIMNTWTTQEQNLAYISSSLRAIQQLDDADQEHAQEDPAGMNDWIGPALQGAIGHILEPIHQQLSYLSTGQNSTAPTAVATHSSPLPSGVVANVIILLVDPEDDCKEGEDTYMGDDNNGQAWRYGDQDLREVLTEALNKLQDYIKSTKVVNIHMDFIRISTLQQQTRADVVGEDVCYFCMLLQSLLIGYPLRPFTGTQLPRCRSPDGTE